MDFDLQRFAGTATINGGQQVISIGGTNYTVSLVDGTVNVSASDGTSISVSSARGEDFYTFEFDGVTYTILNTSSISGSDGESSVAGYSFNIVNVDEAGYAVTLSTSVSVESDTQSVYSFSLPGAEDNALTGYTIVNGVLKQGDEDVATLTAGQSVQIGDLTYTFSDIESSVIPVVGEGTAAIDAVSINAFTGVDGVAYTINGGRTQVSSDSESYEIVDGAFTIGNAIYTFDAEANSLAALQTTVIGGTQDDAYYFVASKTASVLADGTYKITGESDAYVTISSEGNNVVAGEGASLSVGENLALQSVVTGSANADSSNVVTNYTFDVAGTTYYVNLDNDATVINDGSGTYTMTGGEYKFGDSANNTVYSAKVSGGAVASVDQTTYTSVGAVTSGMSHTVKSDSGDIVFQIGNGSVVSATNGSVHSHCQLRIVPSTAFRRVTQLRTSGYGRRYERRLHQRTTQLHDPTRRQGLYRCFRQERRDFELPGNRRQR